MIQRTATTQQDLPAPNFARLQMGTLQRKCACGQHTIAGGKCAECRKKRLSLQRRATNQTEPTTVPPIVHDVLRPAGRPLDPATRAFMEPRFGHDFSRVRVHTDAQAAASARALKARAYAVGEDLAFGTNQYAPTSGRGLRLIAHELAHVVQQQQGGGSLEAEPQAEAAAERVTRGQSVVSEMIGGASPGLYAQNDEEEEARRAPTTRPAFSLRWEDLTRSAAFQLPTPSLTVPALTRPTLGVPPLRPPTLPPPSLVPPSLGLPGPTVPPITAPSPTGQGAGAPAPELPSRLPVLERGRFSLGLRLGFPEAEARSIPGAPESALAASLRRARIMNELLTGEVPTGWEAVDKAKLAKAIWGIFSTNIAPDLARSITSGLSTSAGPAGISYELDLVLLTDFSGGGLSFTIRY